MGEKWYHESPDSFNQTRRSILMGCPRRFFIEYVLGLEKQQIMPSKGLRMGDAHATALEAGDTSVVSKVYEPWIAEANTTEEAKSLYKEMRVVEIYVAVYMDEHGVAPERELEWDLELPGAAETKHFKHLRNRGAMDFAEPGLLGLTGGEDKLLSQWSQDKADGLHLDYQVTGHFYAMERMGRPLVDLKYRVTKKSGIDQRMKNKPETLEEYLDRLLDVLTVKRSEHFLQYTLRRSPEQLQEFEDELGLAVEYLDWLRERELQGKASWPKQMGTCSYQGGCSHPDICGGMPNAMAAYTKKEQYA